MVEFSENLLRLVTCQTHSQARKVNPMKPFLIGFVFAVGLHASLLTFSNSATISIPDNGPSIPYPSQIDVPDIGDPSSMTVELLGINHTFPKDIDVLLVDPTGDAMIILSDTAALDWVNLDLTLSDSASSHIGNNTTSGTYLPTDAGFCAGAFPSPAGLTEKADRAGRTLWHRSFSTVR
jgi:hypothetical protein